MGLQALQAGQIAQLVAFLQALKPGLRGGFVGAAHPVGVALHGQFAVELLEGALLVLVQPLFVAWRFVHRMAAGVLLKTVVRLLGLAAVFFAAKLGVQLGQVLALEVQVLAHQRANAGVLLAVKVLQAALDLVDIGL